MDHLRRMGKVIYLHLEYETMCRRIQNLDSRGVVLQAGYTLQDMYKERLPLYRRYADAVIKCDNNTVEQTGPADRPLRPIKGERNGEEKEGRKRDFLPSPAFCWRWLC